jgi:hypothetical protein
MTLFVVHICIILFLLQKYCVDKYILSRISSGMLRCVVHVSGECITSIIRETTIGELGTTLAVLPTEASCGGFFLLARATRRTIPDDGILHSHRRENLTTYIALTGRAL